jgi:hypothetical protein
MVFYKMYIFVSIGNPTWPPLHDKESGIN